MSAPTVPPALRRRAGDLLESAATVAERVAFWASVALPCVHLPVLAVYGLGPDTTPLLVALWSFHAATLLAGRRHRTDRPADTDERGDRGDGSRLQRDGHRDRRDGSDGDGDGTDADRRLGAGD